MSISLKRLRPRRDTKECVLEEMPKECVLPQGRPLAFGLVKMSKGFGVLGGSHCETTNLGVRSIMDL